MSEAQRNHYSASTDASYKDVSYIAVNTLSHSSDLFSVLKEERLAE